MPEITPEIAAEQWTEAARDLLDYVRDRFSSRDMRTVEDFIEVAEERFPEMLADRAATGERPHA